MSVLDLTRPSVMSVPQGSVGSAGAEAVDLARMAGLELDPWQALVLESSLAERADGKWCAFEVGLVVPRQNGKGALLEARELAGLFLLGERLLIHSAHEFGTSLEAFRRLLFLIEATPELDSRVLRVSRAHGEEGIELKSRQRIRFRTRTKGGGRGYTGDWLGLDEAMIIPTAAHGALLPTLSARPNPQVWYTGSAVDQRVHEHGVVLARVRARGRKGDDPSLAYFEWSADAESPDDVSGDMAADPGVWAAANPALGIRVSGEHVERERVSMDPRTFAVERLNVGDWPAVDGAGESVIALDAWRGLVDGASVFTGAPVFAVDVAFDRRSAAIVAAGWRDDGAVHVEVVDHAAGSAWVAGRLRELRDRHQPSRILLDGVGNAALVEEIRHEGVIADELSTRDFVSACTGFVDRVNAGTVRHLGDGLLEQAVRVARKRDLVDAWAWSRKSSAGDISPLVAATVATHGLVTASSGEVWGAAWD